MKAAVAPARASSPLLSTTWITLYGVTIFLGAFLLFQVQLVFAKGILPWFGGAPSVWTSCMLVFQCLLLAGYFYAHLIVSNLSFIYKRRVHIVVVGLALAWTVILALAVKSPLVVGGGWRPASAEISPWRIIALVGTGVGIQFFLLSTTSPIVQHWYSLHTGTPYRLYALSNVGSLLGLLTYPLIFEPMMGLRSQAWLWALMFLAYSACYTACALGPARLSGEASPPKVQSDQLKAVSARFPMLLWVALPACASLMLLAATNLMSQEIAVVPFLWALPLAVYLFSFVLTFDSPKWYRREVFFPLFVVSVVACTYVVLARTDVGIMNQINAYSLALFSTCMVCHGEVSRLKPPAARLTSFYLMLAIGGALGGSVAAVVAPLFFRGYWELQIAIAATAICAFAAVITGPPTALGKAASVLPYLTFAGLVGLRFVSGLSNSRELQSTLGGPVYWLFLGVAAVTLGLTHAKFGSWSATRAMGAISVLAIAILMAFSANHHQGGVVSAHRNFFGITSILRSDSGDSFGLRHGETLHGSQYLDPSRRDEPTIYYAKGTGIGLLLQNFPRTAASGEPKSLRIGVVGLGVGTLATYGHKGDSFCFYEIDPDMARIATGETGPFTFMKDSAASVQVILGDGRLSLEKESPQQFDVLVIDAFSSGSIPVHLLTREAMRVYERHLAGRESVIAFHVSNRALDLRPVLVGLAKSADMQLLHILKDGADWVLMSHNPVVLKNPAIADFGTNITLNQDPPLWTDDYTNLLQVLK